jgi:hypothetical protein
LGSIKINGIEFGVTKDLMYGTPPSEDPLKLQPKDQGDLSQHSIYPTYFGEFIFNFDPTRKSGLFNTEDHPGLESTSEEDGKPSMYWKSFDIDVSGLVNGYAIHFDLYNTTSISQSCTDLDDDQKMLSDDQKKYDDDKKTLEDDKKRLDKDRKSLEEDLKKYGPDHQKVKDDQKKLGDDEEKYDADKKKCDTGKKKLEEGKKKRLDDEGQCTSFTDININAFAPFSHDAESSKDRDPKPVPEPTTLALLGIGLIGLGAARKRRAV